MRRYKSHTNGERYVGNKLTKEVHDLDNEKPQCKVDDIIDNGNDEAFRYFYESKIKNYTVCSFCFGVFIEVIKKK
ncbi:MAG: hypothetical protein IPM56_03110 [Ignavibacteriales bacterium]|nr:MAG: hypothetical protein IPM56_03110 [Ignavibacteriales bacterium]